MRFIKYFKGTTTLADRLELRLTKVVLWYWFLIPGLGFNGYNKRNLQ